MDSEATGGAIIGEGAYGCIFMPPLKCKDESDMEQIGDAGYPSFNTIDKLLEIDDANQEIAIARRIYRLPLWKNYFIVAESMCEPAPIAKQTNKELPGCDLITNNLDNFRLIRMRFGGRPLAQVSFNPDAKIYDFIVHLISASALLTLFGIVHRDLHRGNVLVDSHNVPRIIDFNLSLDAKGAVSNSDFSKFRFDVEHNHEPPDSCMVRGVYSGLDGFKIIDMFMKERKSLRKIQSILGITADTLREEFVDFYRKSKIAQSGNMAEWFRTYWRTIDSWAIGMMIVNIFSKSMLWEQFVKGEYGVIKSKVIPVIRDMVQLNPKKRIDSVQALARLDPDNYIIRKYAGKWLEKVSA